MAFILFVYEFHKPGRRRPRLLSYKIHQLQNSNYAVSSRLMHPPAHHNLTEFSLLGDFDDGDSVSLSEESSLLS